VGRRERLYLGRDDSDLGETFVKLRRSFPAANASSSMKLSTAMTLPILPGALRLEVPAARPSAD